MAFLAPFGIDFYGEQLLDGHLTITSTCFLTRVCLTACDSGNASSSLRAGDNVTFMVAARTMSSWVALGLSRDGTDRKSVV